MNVLNNKTILVGITGSIAAYKTCELIRMLTDAGAKVEVAVTPAATNFIGTATLQALSGNPVLTDLWSGTSEGGMDHIAAVRRCDLYVIAPITANSIAKLATGFADDIVSALACSATCPIVLAPAMNKEMLNNPFVAQQITQLQQDSKYSIVDTEVGELACGEYGQGRLANVADIYAQIQSILTNANIMQKKSVVVTAGATSEKIDDMRVISNLSSGRMGIALAQAAKDAGADVHLILANSQITPPGNLDHITKVQSVDEIHHSSLELTKDADMFISVAAISDFKPKKISSQKIKRSNKSLNLELIPTQDVIADIAAKHKNTYCVAFAAESENLTNTIKKAKLKLKQKKVNAIVASPIKSNLNSATCDLALITKNEEVKFGVLSKQIAANKLIYELANRI